MHLYALINVNGISRLDMEEPMSLKQMKDLVGKENDPDATVEFVSKQFSDQTISLICDDDFIYKKLPITCITPYQLILQGQVIAVAVTLDGDSVGLTEQQFQLIQRELIIVNSVKVQNNEQANYTKFPFKD